MSPRDTPTPDWRRSSLRRCRLSSWPFELASVASVSALPLISAWPGIAASGGRAPREYWIAYRPLAPAPPDLAPLEQAVALATADEANWKEAAVAGSVAPEVVGPAYDAAKARREQAEQRLFEARQTAGLDDQRLTLAERWGAMSVPERRRALQAFEVVAQVERGRQPLDERVTIELRGSPTGDGWEPDVEYRLPSDQELAEQIAAEFAAAGLNITNVAGRIAAWTAKHADTRIVIKPLKLTDEDKKAAEAIFGPLEPTPRKRARKANTAA